MRIQHLTSADYRIMPWANGRGQTVELLKIEDDKRALHLRLSVADVVEAGAFSRLPGIDRVLTLIEGEGFDLDFGGVAPGVSALPFAPVAFSGDWDTRADNLRGPSRDFNVMTARRTYDVEASRAVSGAIVPADVICLYVVSGSAVIAMGQPVRHCEEQSDEAIQEAAEKNLNCFASLAMTEVKGEAEVRLSSRDLLIIKDAGTIDLNAAGDVLAIRLTPRSV